MSDNLETMKQLLLSYVGLLAERNAYGPGEGFEFKLFGELQIHEPTLISKDEQKELIQLVIHTDHWVCFNLQTGMYQLSDRRRGCCGDGVLPRASPRRASLAPWGGPGNRAAPAWLTTSPWGARGAIRRHGRVTGAVIPAMPPCLTGCANGR